jgi:hypothetical protein
MVTVQYKCGNDYSNAVFYTDSINFCVFIGVYIPGSFKNNYSVKRNKNDIYDFYSITEIRKIDTVKSETYLLTDLKKENLLKFVNSICCPNRVFAKGLCNGHETPLRQKKTAIAISDAEA